MDGNISFQRLLLIDQQNTGAHAIIGQTVCNIGKIE